MKNPRNNKMKASPPAKTIKIANANNIVPIKTYEDTNERLRRNVDPKRYANPNSPDGKWPRRIKV